MDEYIKLKDVFHILDIVMNDESIKRTGKAIRKRLKELPAIEIAEGEWVKNPNPRLGFESMYIWSCSRCDKAFTFHPNYDFCPYCGAIMKKKAGINDD